MPENIFHSRTLPASNRTRTPRHSTLRNLCLIENGNNPGNREYEIENKGEKESREQTGRQIGGKVKSKRR